MIPLFQHYPTLVFLTHQQLPGKIYGSPGLACTGRTSKKIGMAGSPLCNTSCKTYDSGLSDYVCQSIHVVLASRHLFIPGQPGKACSGQPCTTNRSTFYFTWLCQHVHQHAANFIKSLQDFYRCRLLLVKFLSSSSTSLSILWTVTSSERPPA